MPKINKSFVVKSFSFCKAQSTSLATWVVTGIGSQRVKDARESFKCKLKSKEGILTNPTLDDDLYTELKAYLNFGNSHGPQIMGIPLPRHSGNPSAQHCDACVVVYPNFMS